MKKKWWIIIAAVVLAICVAVVVILLTTGDKPGDQTGGQDHTHDYQTSVIEPICGVQGYTLHKCSCGEEYRDNYVDALEHEMGGWQQIKAPEVGVAGKEERRCQNDGCNYVEDREIEALGQTVYQRVDKDGTPNEEGEYAMFGSYPQSLEKNTAVISALNGKAGTNPTSSNSYNWTSYRYYKLGTKSNFMWYIDVEYTNGVGETSKYRGVYFTEYRLKSATLSTTNVMPNYWVYDYASYQQNSTTGYFKTSTVYWFKYEPLQWRILFEYKNMGYARILCESVIDNQPYDFDGEYHNNYQNSTIRTWLNDTFYNTAFNDREKEIIQTTVVDNSARSSYKFGASSTNNPYACPNTNDKVYLLSVRESDDSVYGFFDTYDDLRKIKPTDYAVSQGCFLYNTNYMLNKNTTWWTRSPAETNESRAWQVSQDGMTRGGNAEAHYCAGILPAVNISL